MSKLDLSKYKKCTPGPWKVNYAIGDKTIQISGNTNFYPDKDFIWIDNDDCDHKESKANALLIADAPQLLAELRKAMEENERLRTSLEECLRYVPTSTSHGHKAYIQAQQALTRKDA